jgi:hypothetical protein
VLRRNIILEDASSRVSPNLDKLLTSFSGKHKAAMREAVIQVSNQALMAANVNIEQRRALVSALLNVVDISVGFMVGPETADAAATLIRTVTELGARGRADAYGTTYDAACHTRSVTLEAAPVRPVPVQSTPLAPPTPPPTPRVPNDGQNDGKF